MYAFVGDIHLGTKIPQIDYLKSLNDFLGLIKSHKEECHCIFICGDLFDHRLNIEESKFAAFFLLNLVCNNCGRNGKEHVPVHFIHGTYTHDYDQYEIFMPLLQKLSNTEIFYTKTVCENIVNGKRVLYLPQEYGDIDYHPYFSNQSYDIIVGHGPIATQYLAPCKSTQYEILHSAEQLGDISKICVFGHFHGYTDFGDNVFYTGPWLRWQYGEDTPRVFVLCDDEYNIETFENKTAMIFETIHVSSPDELRDQISQEITNPHRFIIHCKNGELEEYHAIMNVYKKNKYLKFQIMTEKTDNDNNQKLNVIENEHTNTLISIEPVPALIEYIKDKYNVDTTEDIKDYESKINNES